MDYDYDINEEDVELVKSHYPDAEYRCNPRTNSDQQEEIVSGHVLLGSGETEAQAWSASSNRIKTGKGPLVVGTCRGNR